MKPVVSSLNKLIKKRNAKRSKSLAKLKKIVEKKLTIKDKIRRLAGKWVEEDYALNEKYDFKDMASWKSKEDVEKSKLLSEHIRQLTDLLEN
jgi:hypothetical protein